MLGKLTSISDYFRNIPAAFLVAIITVLACILFLPEEYAKTFAVEQFRMEYRSYIGPAFLLTIAFAAARVFMFFLNGFNRKSHLKKKQKILHNLTPEEKGYLFPYITYQENSVYVGMDDGVMAGLRAKKITYCASSMGTVLDGFAFNLQPWAREYLSKHSYLLEGAVGKPLTPQAKVNLERYW